MTVTPIPIVATWYLGDERKFEWTVIVTENGEVGGVWTLCTGTFELASGALDGSSDDRVNKPVAKNGTASYTTHTYVTSYLGRVANIRVQVTFVDDLQRTIYLDVVAPARDLI